MRQIEPEQPDVPLDLAESREQQRLRRENQELKRRIEELQGAGHDAHSGVPIRIWRPSAVTIWALVLGAVVLAVIAFLAGYVPLRDRKALVAAETHEQGQALPRVEVIEVGRASGKSELQFPGNIQAITEAPILARADGYVQRRLVDIGDRVQAGQPLAEIDAPELDEQVHQAQATLQQAQAGVEQALANYQKGKTDAGLAQVSAQRWATLAAQGVVSRQDNDRYQSEYQSLAAAEQALDKAIAVARSNVAAAQASLARLQKIQGYRVVKAPFAGVITLRNVDVGAMVNSGNTLLYRIAQTNPLRLYVNVPQANASSIHPGQAARLSVSNLPGRSFTGTVARTANALDPASRTLLVEVTVPNPDGALLPGMYARVDLTSTRSNAPLLIPSDALIARSEGTAVAVVRPDHTVHLQKIEVGRDYGDRLEVIKGLQVGAMIIPNPGDVVREGTQVDPIVVEYKARGE